MITNRKMTDSMPNELALCITRGFLDQPREIIVPGSHNYYPSLITHSLDLYPHVKRARAL